MPPVHTIKQQPLGGNQTFHRQVSKTADFRNTNRKLNDIRDTLLHGGPHSTNSNRAPERLVRIEKNALELNNAHEASVYRGVPCRVRSGAFGPINRRSHSKVSLMKATKCNRWEIDSELAHACDVLGPYACADCIRIRMQRNIHDEADRTFPGIHVTERDLCVRSSSNGERLPPIPESVIKSKDSTLSATTTSTNANRTPDRRFKAQLLRMRSRKEGLLPITNAELQNRVIRKRFTQDNSSRSNTYFSPKGITDGDPESTRKRNGSPKIKVDIQIPMVSTSREQSLSQV